MTAQLVKRYLDKYFIGQELIKQELSILLQAMVNGYNFSILFRGGSGSGKTYLSEVCVNYLLIKAHEDFSYYLMDTDNFRLTDKRIHILDEVHKFKDQELIYPYLDSGKYTVFICTNEYDELKDPLIRRCINFTFESYSIEELMQMAQKYFMKRRVELKTSYLEIIVSSSRFSPASVLMLSKRLFYIFKQEGIPTNELKLLELISKYFKIEEGLSEVDREYLSFLKRNGMAGLNTLSVILGIPKKIITDEIEPFLIKRNLIRITPRGRILYEST